MADYQRKTALAPSEILDLADGRLQQLIGLTKSKGSAHGATFTGPEGTAILSVHRHGPYTLVVASTDGLRTSRIDYEIQRFLTSLPYEPGDRSGPGKSEST